MCDWDWMLDSYNDDIIEETYELGPNRRKVNNKFKLRKDPLTTNFPSTYRPIPWN